MIGSTAFHRCCSGWRRLLVVLALFVCAGQVHATTLYGSWQDALAACNAFVHTAQTNGRYNITGCLSGSYQGQQVYHEWYAEYYTQPNSGGTHVHGDFPYNGAPPANPCTGPDVPALTGIFPGRILASYSWCKAGVPDPVSGGTLSCVMSFTTSGPPTRNQWGSWSTPGTLASSGATCDGSGGGGSNNWNNANGQPAGDPVPPSPDSNPPKAPPSKICGGGSCYDPTNDNFCAVADGVQVCVPGGGARGDNGGANAGTPNGSTPGACSSSASATVCAGSPTAPKPSPSNVPDPPTQVVSNDTYTQANPITGTPIVVQTTTYNSGNASSGASPPTSGQQSGDSGPAGSSSTSGPSGSYSGGGNCDSPPVCSGDASVCGFARQSWALQCQLHGDVKALTDTAGFDALDHSTGPNAEPSQIFSEATGSGSGSDSSILDSLDASGFGGGAGQCPVVSQKIEVEGNTLVDWGPLCDAASKLAALILAIAYAYGAFIIGRSKAS